MSFARIPGLPPEEEAAAKGSEDDAAEAEARMLGQGLSQEELTQKAAEGEHNRNEAFRDNFETIAIIALWVGAVCLLILVLSWVFHLLMPEAWHWLSVAQLERVQNFVTGGIIASLATGHLRKRTGTV